TMPTPPASLTALLLSTRSLVPRSQTTILPATLAGSRNPSGCAGSHVLEKHSRAEVASAPDSAASVDSTSGEDGTALPRPMPTSTPSPTASSIALLMSLLLPEAVPSALCHSALYIATRAAGATPLNLPKSLPSTVIGTP